jgi:hypothetical protein
LVLLSNERTLSAGPGATKENQFMRHWLLAIVVASIWYSSVHGQDKAVPNVPDQVNFADHVAPIVFSKCVTCHRPGEAAPFALLTYQDVRKRAKMIRLVTEQRTMPPWHPAPGHGEFLNERCLSDQQIAVIKRWVDTGMAEGDPKNLPKPPEFPEGWALGKPDLVVTMDKAYTVPATGRDIYATFTLPVNLPEDKWVTAVDLKASARSVVHHVLLFAASGNKKIGKGGGLAGLALGGGNSLGGWVPGTLAQHLPNDLAMPLPKGSNIVLQTHFHPSGKEEQEKTTVALYFAKKKPARTLVNFQAPPFFGIASGLNIPADAKDYQVKGKFKVPVDVELISIMGHAHYVCESMRATATLPDGTTKSLLYLPHWDFNWQSTYQYKEPVKLPKGTVIDVVITYNNSADNPANPYNPPKRIKWGEASTDEMGSVIINCVASQESDAAVLKRAILLQLIETVGSKFGDFKKSNTPEPQPKDTPFAELQAATKVPLHLEGAKAAVLLFLNTDCPIANYYTAEVGAIVKDYAAEPLRFFVVHVDPGLTPEAAAQHAKTWKLTCPVLLDSKHQLVKLTGATITPETAVVLPDGTLAYRGRIDDCYIALGKRRAEPNQHDLREALTAILQGRPVAEPRTKAIGCFIQDLR